MLPPYLPAFRFEGLLDHHLELVQDRLSRAPDPIQLLGDRVARALLARAPQAPKLQLQAPAQRDQPHELDALRCVDHDRHTVWAGFSAASTAAVQTASTSACPTSSSSSSSSGEYLS